MLQFVVFYHVAQVGPNWRDIYTEQMNLFEQSGLLDEAISTFLCYEGDEGLPFIPNGIAVRKYDKPAHEVQTLTFLKEFCDKLLFNIPVLYIHSKGVTAHLREPGVYESTTLWRRYLEEKVVTNRQECLDALTEYDHCGPLFSRNFLTRYNEGNEPRIAQREMPFYHGNFWWANSEHIKNLSISDLHSRPLHTKRGTVVSPDRQTCQELWVASKGRGKNVGSYMFTTPGPYTSDWTKPEVSRIHIEPILPGLNLSEIYQNKNIHWLYLPLRDILLEEMIRLGDNTEIKIGNILYRNSYPWEWVNETTLRLQGYKEDVEIL